MKRGISFLLSAALVIGTFAPIQLYANQPKMKTLPAVGEVVAGFKTLERGTMDVVNAETVVFEHEKSGAQLVYVQNGDKDRAFDISFKTPALDNTGANHILEHSAVSGSEKYPLKSIIFSVVNQTYSTFANAFTAINFTSYPVSSMSEDQLLKLMDVYMDCTLNPSIYTDEKVFEREAWRYEKVDEEAPLSITGTVYSEMQGALGNIGSAAYYNVLDALFPESVLANISGGDPEYIPDLTYERLLEVHRTYYHPSNALIILYGDLDYEKFLSYLDEAYLSKYDKKEIVVDNGYVQPFTVQQSKVYDYPVAKTTQTANSAQVDYAYALTNLSTKEVVAMDVVTAILGHEASTLQKAFKQSGISGNLVVSYDISVPQPILTFSVQNTDVANKESIKALIDKSISQMIDEGFDAEITDAIIASAEFSNANTTEMPNVGINISMAVAQNWVARGDFSYIEDYNKHLESIKNQVGSKYLEGLASKYIVDNQHAALVATVPKAGLLEENSEKRAAKIQAIEQSMTPEEVQKVIEQTTAFNVWNAKEEDQERVKSLQAVGIAELPVELKAYTIHDETQDGVRYLMAEADVANTINANLLFDTSGVPVEQLHYLKLLADLTGKLGTENYTKEAIDILNTRYLNGISAATTTWQHEEEADYHPVYMVGFSGLAADYEQSVEILEEILLRTDFSQEVDVLKVVQSLRSNYKMAYTQNPLGTLVGYSLASHNKAMQYQNYMSAIDYYKFLGEVETTLQRTPEVITKELKAVRDNVLNQTNLIVEFAGNKNNMSTFKEVTSKTVAHLPKYAVEKQDYSQLSKPAKQLGIAVDTTVNYNMISASMEDLGLTFNGKYIPLMNVIGDNYLTPQIRYQNNAYDTIAQITPEALLVTSYRDPHIDKTKEVYEGISKFVRDYDLTQETLDRYIMKSFGEYSAPQGELNGAINEAFNYLQGRGMEKRLELLQQIKSAKVSDFKALADAFDTLMQVGSWGSAASQETLTQYGDLYQEVVTIEEEATNQEVVYLTKEQLATLYIGPNTFEMAVQQGLMSGAAEEMVTKEEVMMVLDKILAAQGASQLLVADTTTQITDQAEISEEARDTVSRFVGSGIVSLDEKGCIHPKSEVTEKEAMDMVMAVNTFLMSLQQPAA